MKDKILAHLKTRLAGYAGGIQESFLDGIAESYSKTIADETKIATDIPDIAIESIKAAYTAFQSENDRRVKDALKAFRTKHGLDENGLPIKKEDSKKDNSKKDSDPDEPAYFKAYRESVDAELAELKSKLENQEKEKARMTLVEKVKSHDKLKGIPASFLSGRNLIPESEDKLDQLAASIEADYTAFKQEMAEQGVHISVPPAGGSGIKEGAAIGKAIAEKKNTNASEGVKGKAI